MPKLYWPVTDGPLHHPLFDPSSRRITYNGVNYVREQVNPVQSALISDNNPLGVTLGGGAHSVSKNIQSGLYATNYTQWFDGKVDTLAGVRLTNALLASISQGTAPPKPSNTKVYFKGEAYNYSFGSTFRLTDWLRPYISLSDSFNTPADFNNDPYGDNAPFAHSLGEEVGIKMTSPNKTISGSIAFYNVVSKNEQYQISSNLQNYINPAGLNGTFGFPSRWIVVDRASKGVQALVTASPSKKLRLRFSAAYTDGTIKNNTAYAQLYNDQFNANKQGQVTYADGTVVYVPPTFSSTTLTTTSATAGALPLTVAMMSAPGSQYYANPVAVTGQINTGSNAAKVLSVIDKVHGPILTGATGLPISALQIDPALSGVNVPGTIVTSQSGDSTTGYPKIGMNVTSVYTLSSGWAKGLEVGGTAILGWGIRNFYYYPTGVTPAAARSLFKMPTLSRFDLIVGYSRRFQRVTWRAQLNVTNLFDRYQRILVPDGSAGWAGPDQVAYTQSPRLFQLSNTISF